MSELSPRHRVVRRPSWAALIEGLVVLTFFTAVAIAFILEPFVSLLMRIRFPRSLASFVVCSLALLAVYAYTRRWHWLYALAGIATLYTQYLGAECRDR